MFSPGAAPRTPAEAGIQRGYPRRAEALVVGGDEHVANLGVHAVQGNGESTDLVVDDEVVGSPVADAVVIDVAIVGTAVRADVEDPVVLDESVVAVVVHGDVAVAEDVVVVDLDAVRQVDEDRRRCVVGRSEPLVAVDHVGIDDAGGAVGQLNAVRGEVLLRRARADRVVRDRHVHVAVRDDARLLVVRHRIVGDLHELRVRMRSVEGRVPHLDGVAFLAAGGALVDADHVAVRDAPAGSLEEDAAEPVVAAVADVREAGGRDREPGDVGGVAAVRDDRARVVPAVGIDRRNRVVGPVQGHAVGDVYGRVRRAVADQGHRHAVDVERAVVAGVGRVLRVDHEREDQGEGGEEHGRGSARVAHVISPLLIERFRVGYRDMGLVDNPPVIISFHLFCAEPIRYACF